VLEVQPVIPLVASSTRWMQKPYVKGMYPNAFDSASAGNGLPERDLQVDYSMAEDD